MIEYPHPKLNEEVEAIGGHYRFVKEVRIPYEGKELLYFIGYVFMDTSCCGVAGCGYAMVPGFIVNWKNRLDASGQPISEIEPIQEPEHRRHIQQWIKQKEHLQQVEFYTSPLS